MIELGVQSKNIVFDENPIDGFKTIKQAGFSCCDFSLNSYLSNTSIYKQEINSFFDSSNNHLLHYFEPHKRAAEAVGVRINQVHMPYPIYISNASRLINEYLLNQVAHKSIEICHFLGSKYIVVHGIKRGNIASSENSDWQYTEQFIRKIAPLAIERGITICLENLYENQGGHLIEGPCCDARKAVQRIQKINHEYGVQLMGFCLDTGHANLIGLDVEEFIITLGEHLKILHIHDNDGVRDLHQIPFTFSGNRENNSLTDWDGFIRGLRKIGYNQVLSFETAPVLTNFPEKMSKDVLRFIANIGDYFKYEIEKIE